ncbi:hypothetical protein CN918_30670 [Priestia megaterium]|nr:hypothetical protein CN918_30670 [Priestia megaterium]
MESVKHTIDFVEGRPEENVDEWKVVLKYKNKEASLPFKVEKGVKMADCSTERLLYFYFYDAERSRPYPTAESFHKGYVPHFDLPKAKWFFDSIKAVEVALVNLLGDDYQTVENQVKSFMKKEDKKRKN